MRAGTDTINEEERAVASIRPIERDIRVHMGSVSEEGGCNGCARRHESLVRVLHIGKLTIRLCGECRDRVVEALTRGL